MKIAQTNLSASILIMAVTFQRGIYHLQHTHVTDYRVFHCRDVSQWTAYLKVYFIFKYLVQQHWTTLYYNVSEYQKHPYVPFSNDIALSLLLPPPHTHTWTKLFLICNSLDFLSTFQSSTRSNLKSEVCSVSVREQTTVTQVEGEKQVGRRRSEKQD